MPSTIDNIEIKLKQLIPPRPQATRGKPFPLSGSEVWFIYPHGNNVYLYNFKDQSLSKEYREHAYPVGVSKLSPSGNFVASGDQCGNLRVWTVETLETKLELRVLGGKINDLEWSEDEKYIAVCGEGRDQFANVIKVDGGASFGELTGPSKPCPSITLHTSTLLLASDDKTLTIYRASPTFKFARTLRDHDNFVQVVKFRGDGKVFASAGADGKVFIYSSDNDYNLMTQIKAHDMGVLAMEWIDNKNLLTASSDKSLKLWSVPEGTLLFQSEVSNDWNFEKQICGLKLIGKNILILRLDGSIELRDKTNLKWSEDTKLIKGIGHSKGIVDIIQSEFDDLNSVSYDGNLKTWKREKENFLFSSSNEFHFTFKNVQKLIEKGNSVVSENKIISRNGQILEFDGKIVGQENEKFLTSNGNLIFKGEIIKKFDDKIGLAIIKNGNFLLFTEDFTLKFYNSNYNLTSSIDITAKITAMAFNSNCTALVTADDQRRIKIYSKVENQSSEEWVRQHCQWCNHSARIDTLLWLDDDLILSAGVDGHILAWSLQANKIGPIKSIKSAHSSPINMLTKSGNGEFASVASDSCIKIWSMQ